MLTNDFLQKYNCYGIGTNFSFKTVFFRTCPQLKHSFLIMKQILCLLIFLCAFKAYSTSEIRMSLEELVQNSEIIVVADLSEIQSRDEGDVSFKNGILTIKKNIWGKFQTGDRITLYWVDNESSLGGPNHQDTKGKHYIWMLNVDEDGKFHASTRQRVRKLEEEHEIDSLLKANPFYLKTSMRYYPENSPVEISLVYRNAYSHSVKLPKTEYKDATLYIHPALKITVRNRELPSEKIVQVTDSIQINARTEFLVTIPMRDIIGFEEHGYYWLKLFTTQESDLSTKNGRTRVRMIGKTPLTEAEEKIANEKYLESLKWKEIAKTGFYYVRDK